MARRRTFGQQLGARVRARRDAAGLSQAELAEKADISANYVGMLERGEKLPALDTLVNVARALAVPVAALLEDGHAKNPWLDELNAVAGAVPTEQRALVLAVVKAIAKHPPR